MIPTGARRTAATIKASAMAAASAAAGAMGANDLRRSSARSLADRLGRLHGMPQKLGQVLSMGKAIGSDSLAILREGGDPIPFGEVEGILERAWGHSWREVFREIEPHGRAASIGQVHRAVDREGRALAVKVRYPGIPEAIRSDLAQLGRLAMPFGALTSGFDLAAYRAELGRNFAEEIDYRLEAVNQYAMRNVSLRGEGVLVPAVVETFVREDVLVSEWMDGETIDDVEKEWSEEERHLLSRRLARFFLDAFFDHGIVHADPHPGNYRFRRSSGGPSIVLHDFGSVFRPTADERLTLLRIIRDCRDSRHNDLPALYGRLGFDEELMQPARQNLAAFTSVLFEPYLSEGAASFDAAGRSERVRDILGDHRWNVRFAGPARLLFLMRAFAGLEYYLERLGAPVRLRDLVDGVLLRHAVAIDAVNVPSPGSAEIGSTELASHLVVRIVERGETRVQVSLPWRRVEDIESLMEPETVEKIRARGICLTEIVRDCRRNGYRPSPLFSLEENGRTYEVSLR